MNQKIIERTAKLLVNYSCNIKKNDVVMISADVLAKPLVFEIYKQILLNGGYPQIDWGVEGLGPIYYKYASEEQLKKYPKIKDFQYRNTDAFIFIRAPKNRNELKDSDPKKILLRGKVTDPLDKVRLKKRWVIFYWPTETLAKDAGMPFAKYQKFAFSACLVDWKKESKKMKKIRYLLNKSDKIRIVNKDTDLVMSIKGKNAVIADGKFNMPDGEVFTAPVKNSVNGFIKFDFPLRFMGRKIPNIYLEFKNGKVIKANASENEDALKKMLKIDKNSSYIGELGIGCNYYITKFTDDLLFDEKIGGTIHLALGNAYPECLNGEKNRTSSIHADIVKELRNGGRIYADGKLIQENGKWKI